MRATIGRATCAVAAVATVGVSFLPWASSGRRLRDSYELVAVAGRLDLIPASLVGPSRAWSLLPLIAVLTCAAVILQHTWLLAMLSLIVGIVPIGLAIVVFRSPLGTELGARAAIATGLLSVAGALMVIAGHRRRM